MSGTPSRYVDLVREFLQRYPNPTGENVLFPKWEKEVDAKDWQDILDSPELFVASFKEAGHPTIVDLVDSIELSQITATDFFNKMLAVKGKVIAVSDVEPYPLELCFRCSHCDSEYIRKDARQPKCDCDAPDIQLDLTKSKFTDRQILKIQEIVASSNPAKLTLYVTGKKQLRKATAGDKIEALGIYKTEAFRNNQNKLSFVKRFETYCVNNIARNDKEFRPTPKDIGRFKKEAEEEPQFWEKLITSIAPHIAGFTELKEVIALALASTDTEQPLNALFVGDPSVAKSIAILYASKLADNGHYITAAGAKWPSLSAHAQKDEETGSWLIQPGLFALADGGLACIDELQSIEEEVAGRLNEVLEQKQVSYAKAGQVGILPARCAVLAASNSYYGSWRSDLDISDNLKFLGKAREALITRFPIIFIITDVVHEENDRKIARQVLENNSEKAIKQYLEDWQDESGNEFYGFKTLKKFFIYLKSVPMPEIPETVNSAIEQWYIDLRTNKEDRFNKLIKARFLDKAIKIMKLHARILHKIECDIFDFEFAVELLKKSMNATAFDPTTGKLDSNLAEGAQATSKLNKEEQFWKAFDAVKTEAGYSERKAIIGYLVNTLQWDKTEAERYLEAMHNKSKFIESQGSGKYTRI